MMSVILVVALSLAAGAAQTAATRVGAVVQTTAGPVRGVEGMRSVDFRSIPYAVAARFESPRPTAAWTDVRDVSAPGPACPQQMYVPYVPGVNMISPYQSEDCLSVRVHASKRHNNKLTPIIIRFDADSQVLGDKELGDMAALAAGGKVVIFQFNTRLGALAHVSLAGMRAEMSNLAMQDAREALRWIKANAVEFGGDTNEITFLGEHSASFEALLHTAPGNDDILVPKRMAFMTPWFRSYRHINETETLSALWAAEAPRSCGQATSAGQLACLQALPLEAIQAPSQVMTHGQSSFGPGTRIPQQPLDMVSADMYKTDVEAIMIGSSERPCDLSAMTSRYYMTSGPLGFNESDLRNFSDWTGDDYNRATGFFWPVFVGYADVQWIFATAAVYAGLVASGELPNLGVAASTMNAEGLYSCTQKTMEESFARNNIPQYAYNFKHMPDNSNTNRLTTATFGAEQPFFYGNEFGPGHPSYTDITIGFSDFDREVADDCMRWFTRFATKGKPGKGWTKYPAVNHIGRVDADDEEIKANMQGLRDLGGRCESIWAGHFP